MGDLPFFLGKSDRSLLHPNPKPNLAGMKQRLDA